jgi:hypothetical protein
MGTTKKFTVAPPVLNSDCRRPALQNLSVAPRVYAAIIAFVMNLPAVAPVIEAFRLNSPALVVVGLAFLIGFGLPCYLLLRWMLEADITSQADREEHMQTRTANNSTLGVPSIDHRAAA